MLGDGEWVMHNKKINYKEYEKLAGGFYPVNFNAHEWVKAIKLSGAKYICITSRHHDGFSIYQIEMCVITIRFSIDQVFQIKIPNLMVIYKLYEMLLHRLLIINILSTDYYFLTICYHHESVLFDLYCTTF